MSPPDQPGVRDLLAAPSFARLWAIGACVNSMRWYDVLVGALFTLDATGSGLAVAVVTAARSAPMLLFGAFAGVICEALNRKRVMVAAHALAAGSSAAVSLLALLGWARPWHIALAALVSGTVWSTEMATRRRMVGETVAPRLVPRALALDTLSGSLSRLAGPVAAGALYEFAGLAAAFAVSCLVFLAAVALGLGLRHRQETRRLALAQVPRDLAEGLAFARSHTVIAGVLTVTIVMNLLGFPYAALLAPIGREHFMVAPTLIGVLAAAESFGAFLGGLRLTRGDPPGSGRVLLVGGSLLMLGCVGLMPLLPWFWPACALLVLGGVGTAAFANMQSSLLILHAPAQVRSRAMGLLTVCIGAGPLGILLLGTLAELLGPMRAIHLAAGTGFVLVLAAGWHWRRRERAGLAKPGQAL
jgi:MFS family permease